MAAAVVAVMVVAARPRTTVTVIAYVVSPNPEMKCYHLLSW
jgi:hypothetical protein